MSTLQQVTIECLRGAVTPFSLPFEKGKKLTIIYGENGTGKSTICDAFEFLGSGKVGSLDKRGLGPTVRFWPSLGKTPGDVSVQLETSDGTCKASILSGNVVVNAPDKRPRIEVFRKSQILSLIEATPGGRYEAIRRFIDVSGVETSEASLRDLIRSLKENQQSAIAALEQNDAAIRQFWETAGAPAIDPFIWAEGECMRGTDVFEAEGAALNTLQTAYSRLAEIPEGLRSAQDILKNAQTAADNFVGSLEEVLLKASKDAGETIGVLRAAQAYLDKSPAPAVCPLCESAENTKDLASRIQQRLTAFSTLQGAQAKVVSAKQAVERAQQQVEVLRNKAKEQVSKFEKLLAESAWPEDVRLPSTPIPNTLAGLTAWLKDSVDMPGEWRKAEVARHDRRQFIGTLRLALKTWKENEAAQGDLVRLIPKLERALEIAMEERRRFTDEILAAISSEVGRLYEAVHPGEGLNKIALELDPKKRASLEIGASFCGKSTRPQAYFSDSHLDTLGLCVFLALSALEEPKETILILDDVLASVADYIVRGLMNFDDISYVDTVDLLYELALQVVDHFRSYLTEEETARVLRCYEKPIANFIHAQMQNHYFEDAVNYEVSVKKGFTELREMSFTGIGESPKYFKEPVPDKVNIGKYVFGGFTRCLYPVQKFQSDTERRLAVILDRESLKWFRPARGQFLIFYKWGAEQPEYQPDFVAETESSIYMIETKAKNEMENPEVLAKRDAAVKWCEQATIYTATYKGKPWKYLLIPHDAIADNITLKRFEHDFCVFGDM